MTSVMALEGVTSSGRLEDVANTCKLMRSSPTVAGFLQCNGRKLKEAEVFRCVFIVYCVFEFK